MIDVEAFGAAMGDLIREAVEPLQKKIAQLEKDLEGMAEQLQSEIVDFHAEPVAGPAGVNGKDCDMDAVKAHIEAMVKAIPVQNGKDGAPGADGRDGKDGQSVKLEDVHPLIADAVKSMQADVQDFIKSVPVPQDGKSVTIDDVKPILDAAIGDIRKESSAAVEMILKDGRIEREAMQNAIKELRQPEDGKPGKDGENGKDGAPGQKGADGIGLAGAMIDREGALVVTLTNGEVKSLGAVVGKDGAKGIDGRDGMGFDDLKVEYDGEKTITLKFQQGEVTKEAHIVMPINIDRGIYKEGAPYLAGDSVTWGGSYWIAKQDTSAKPDSPDSGWRLIAKRGRDGKDGRNGIDKTAPVALKD